MQPSMTIPVHQERPVSSDTHGARWRDLRRLVEPVSDAIIACDAHLRIQIWNHAAEKLFGLRAIEALGRLHTDTLSAIQYPAGLHFRDLLGVTRRQGHWRGHIRIPRASGRTITALLSTHLIRDPAGQEAGVALICRETTRQWQIDAVRREAAQQERQRLARDLHDSVTQTLYSISLIAEVLPRVWERHPEEGQRQVDELRTLARGALAEMRTLLHELRPATLTAIELGALLRQLGEAVGVQARLAVATTINGLPARRLPPDVQIACYRITQEALNNIVRHAHAGKVTLALRYQPAGIEIMIHDDGIGFDLQHLTPGRMGLDSMRERAEAIGARLTIGSRPGRGTQVWLSWCEDERGAVDG
jgi:two-component system nitrate/nitrite sensor histidine kinase NarX